MDKYKIQLSIKAKNDIKNIVRYIKDVLLEPSIAEKYAKLIEKELKSLEHCPQKFAVIDKEIIGVDNIRKLIIKNYIAFYRINESDRIVNVERVLYGSSNWTEKL